MALTINTTIKNLNGAELTNVYGWVVASNQQAYKIDAQLYLYVSEDAKLNNYDPFVGILQNSNTFVYNSLEIDYNRLIDGVDILNIAHDKFIEKLTEQGLSVTKDLQ